MTGTIVGYDPGGNGAHGVARLRVADARPVAMETGTLASVEDVLRWVEDEPALLAVGVDTFTRWASAPGGWRPADTWLRARYPDARASVASPNTLFGSMSVNGMAVLTALRATRPDLPVTEAHPKVLHRALVGARYAYPAEARAMDDALSAWLGVRVRTTTDHAWDAAASAFAAFAYVTGVWTTDLHALPPVVGTRYLDPAGPTVFAWPDDC